MFILGVGAQKAGTTWLHTQLLRSSRLSTSKAKEWHYWDRHCSIDQLNLVSETERLAHFARISDAPHFHEHSSYFDRILKFKRVLGVRTNPFEIRADITPAYSGLSLGIFNTIRSGFEAFGVDYKVIFMVRDPVSRVISAFNMYQRRLAKEGLADGLVNSRLRDQIGIEFAQTWGCYFRTRYDLTVQNLVKVFPEERVMVSVTEALSREEYAREVASFLNIPHHRSSYREKVNTSQTKIGFSEQAEGEIATYYRNTYEFMAGHVPLVRSLWRGFHYL